MHSFLIISHHLLMKVRDDFLCHHVEVSSPGPDAGPGVSVIVKWDSQATTAPWYTSGRFRGVMLIWSFVYAKWNEVKFNINNPSIQTINSLDYYIFYFQYIVCKSHKVTPLVSSVGQVWWRDGVIGQRFHQPRPSQSGHRPVVMGPGLLCSTGTRGLRLQTSLPGFLASVVLRHPQRDTVTASDINAVIQRKKERGESDTEKRLNTIRERRGEWRPQSEI